MGSDIIWFDECTMEHCMDGYQERFTVLYLDDLLIYSATFGQCLKHLRLVIQRLKRHDIKVKTWHPNIQIPSISYLGRIISSAGYTADPINIIAVSSKLKKKPSSITELRNILGSVGCFRRSIPNFNQTASPLYQILTDIQKNQLTGMIMINLSSWIRLLIISNAKWKT